MQTKMKYFGGLTVALACITAGCVRPAVKSNHTGALADASGQATKGIAYCLPQVQIQLTAVLTNVPIISSSNTYVYTPTVSNSYSQTISISQTNQLTGFFITNTVIQSYTNFSLTALPNTNRLVYLITLTPIICQDPNYLYTLNLTKSKVSSDTFGLSVDPTNSFLQSLNATNADQTIQIVSELAQAAATAVLWGRNPASVPLVATNVSPPKPHVLKPYPGQVDVVFDPTRSDGPGGLAYAQQYIASQFYEGDIDDYALTNSPIQISATFCGGAVTGSTLDSLNNAPQKENGVLYRPLLPYFLTVYNKMGTMGTNTTLFLVRSPNAARVFSLSVSRATFVTDTTSISFNNGFLTSVNYDSPSQMAAVCGLPLTIIGDIFSSITNVLQLRLNIASGQNNIATQQTQYLNQLAALNNAQSNLLQSIQQLKAYKGTLTNSP